MNEEREELVNLYTHEANVSLLDGRTEESTKECATSDRKDPYTERLETKGIRNRSMPISALKEDS